MAKSTSKNWFMKHKILTVIIAILVLGFIGAMTSSKSPSSSSGTASKSGAKAYKFDNRADKQPTDVEINVGESATIDGVKMTPVSAERKTSLSDFDTAADGKQFLVMTVQLENTDSKTHPYNSFDFKIQTAGGQVLDTSFHSSGSPLNSGDLVAGGKTTGTVVLEVPVESGHQYVIWKPDAFKSDRAVVQVQ